MTVTLGARFDHNSIFGNAFSPKIGVNVRVTDQFSARFSYGRGFRAPDLGQLFYRFLNPTNLYQVIGNLYLEKELWIKVLNERILASSRRRAGKR